MVTAYTARDNLVLADTPRRWSDPGFAGVYRFSNGACGFDLAPDGKRFTVARLQEGNPQQSAPARGIVLLNFFDELRRRVPVGGK